MRERLKKRKSIKEICAFYRLGEKEKWLRKIYKNIKKLCDDANGRLIAEKQHRGCHQYIYTMAGATAKSCRAFFYFLICEKTAGFCANFAKIKK